ncbi:MAG: prepilin-type N-terminal cleavage/methylation domain-containing protein [Candidatus Riflebacteria bacterium]|nr:prepilin-type N-terminal cleavage/methylation domain-containing protein [Candidatus Riflebacteria bacterium]
MATKIKPAGFSLVEMMVVVAVVSLLMGFAWHFYFGGRETMRHTVSQSQIQLDTRIFLDNLEVEMASCYAFSEVDTQNKKFSFYAFTVTPPHLDDVYYDTTGKPHTTGVDSDSKLSMVKYEYQWKEDGTVLKKRTPGFLKFLQVPMRFDECPPTDDRYTAMEKTVLHGIADFEIKAYSQKTERDGENINQVIVPTTAATIADAAFIVLRLHTKIDEVSEKRRDEELDIVTKFYSSIKLAEVANPGSFSSTDRDGRF